MAGDAELGPEARFLAFLAEGRFMLQRARGSGRAFFPPRVMEPVTGDANVEWIEASGRGTVHSTTVLHPKPPSEPYNLCLIDLDEGPRMLSRVEGITPEAVAIGQRVTAFIDERDGRPVLFFRPEVGL